MNSVQKRRPMGLASAIVLTVGLLLPVGSAQAAAACTSSLLDVNGDGYDDSVVGVPGEDVGAIVDAGAVTVLLGGPNHLPYGNGGIQITEATLGGTVETGDRFGAAIAVADFNWDGCLDLAIGAPGEADGAGQVALAFLAGSAASASSTTWVSQSGSDPDGTPEAGDGFGESLGYMYKPDFSIPAPFLLVGAPGEDIGSAIDAGSVTRYGDEEYRGQPITDHVNTFHQDQEWLPGSAESGDRFGATLAGGEGWAAVGAPGEDLGTVSDAGMVLVNEGGGVWYSVTQDSRRVPGVAESGDAFGASLAATWACDRTSTLVVGAPGEDLGSVTDAGSVTVLGSPIGGIGTYTVTQDSANIPGMAEADDQFGAAVIGDWSGFAVGTPGEDIGAAQDTGSVTDVWQWCEDGESNKPGPGATFAQSTSGITGADETGDAFGASLSAVYWLDSKGVYQSSILVGVPGEDVGTVVDAGAVYVLPYVRSTSLLTTTGSRAFHEGSVGVGGAVEAGDRFASSLDGIS